MTVLTSIRTACGARAPSSTFRRGSLSSLAAMLEVEMLTEAGWDPAARVLSLPAAHPLLGRTLCRVGGCLSTAHSAKTGGVCRRCFTRLTGDGLSGQQIASSAELTALTIRPGGCAVPGYWMATPVRSTIPSARPPFHVKDQRSLSGSVAWAAVMTADRHWGSEWDPGGRSPAGSQEVPSGMLKAVGAWLTACPLPGWTVK